MAQRITSLPKDASILNQALRDLGTAQGNVADLQTSVATLGALPVLTGNNSPEGLLAAPVGTMFLRKNGGTNTTLYIKETGGAGMSGWVAK